MVWFGWFSFMSHCQQGHLETAPPLTVPCEGREAHVFLHFSLGIKPRAFAWQSFTLQLRPANSTNIWINSHTLHFQHTDWFQIELSKKKIIGQV